MKKGYVALIISVIMILAIFIINFYYPKEKIPTICFSKNCFNIELAQTQQEQQKGLMFRSELDKNKGMLFIFDIESTKRFWMKNTLIPLDMVGLDKDLIIRDIKNAIPCKTTICEFYELKNSKYVLEINSGLANEFGLNIGDKAELK